jgi:hypothetical protein
MSKPRLTPYQLYYWLMDNKASLLPYGGSRHIKITAVSLIDGHIWVTILNPDTVKPLENYILNIKGQHTVTLTSSTGNEGDALWLYGAILDCITLDGDLHPSELTPPREEPKLLTVLQYIGKKRQEAHDSAKVVANELLKTLKYDEITDATGRLIHIPTLSTLLYKEAALWDLYSRCLASLDKPKLEGVREFIASITQLVKIYKKMSDYNARSAYGDMTTQVLSYMSVTILKDMPVFNQTIESIIKKAH